MSFEDFGAWFEARSGLPAPAALLDTMAYLRGIDDRLRLEGNRGFIVDGPGGRMGLSFYFDGQLLVKRQKQFLYSANLHLPASWVAFADVNGGDSLVYNCGTGAIHLYLHEEELSPNPNDMAPMFASTIAAFVDLVKKAEADLLEE